MTADVPDPDQVATVVAAAVDRSGRLDVLVNNAGGAPPAESGPKGSSGFNEKIVALNLMAPMNFCQAVHPIMSTQDGGGVIVNISSVSGTRANPQGMAYGAAKAGLENMTRTLAHEWGPAIRVVALTVGMIVTDEAAAFYGDEEVRPLCRQPASPSPRSTGRRSRHVPRVGLPLARWVTGTCLEVHGGGEGPAYLGVGRLTAPVPPIHCWRSPSSRFAPGDSRPRRIRREPIPPERSWP
ncbi:MAG: hypothetical protein Ct9H300mP12_06280 [Acidimicrobiales bacterium]|nr:MAG: hypothetical protein Ct9H300mP12_06280 [Acidimicrobiales bacterium]